MSELVRDKKIAAVSIAVILQLLLSACYAILFAKIFLHFDKLAFMSLSETALFWTFLVAIILPLGSMAVMKHLPFSQKILIVLELIGGTIAFYGGSVYTFGIEVKGFFFLILGAVSLVVFIWDIACLLKVGDVSDRGEEN